MKSLRHAKSVLAAPTSHIARRSFTSASTARPLAPSPARSATRIHIQHVRPSPTIVASEQIYIF